MFVQHIIAQDSTVHDDPAISTSIWETPEAIDAMYKNHSFDRVELWVNRATLGLKGIDASYGKRKSFAEELEIAWGAYELLEPDTGESPEAQARHFIREVLRYKSPKKDQSVLLALYWAPIFPKNMRKDPSARLTEDQLSEQELSISRYPSVEGTVRAVKEVIRLTGRAPVMFTSLAFLNSFISKQNLSPEQRSTLSGCPLWIISFSGNPIVLPEGCPWANWTFWLHSTHDLFLNDPGHPIAPDLSDFIGRRGAPLEAWLSANNWNYELHASLQ
jgi:hypothetical protein